MSSEIERLYNLFQNRVYTYLLHDNMDLDLGIKRVEKENATSKYPKTNPDQPRIYWDSEKTNLHYFGIKDIYMDLFTESKTSRERVGNEILITKKVRAPLVSLPAEYMVDRDDAEILAFLLPQKVLDTLKERGALNSDERGALKSHDFQEFLLESTNNKKITNLILSLFMENKLEFVRSIQKHFIEILKPASYSNNILKDYLTAVGNYLIVPASISKESNKRFISLLNSDNHDDISTVIANIFISSMLGLYSMKYGKSGRYYKKTYFLNELGMEYVWLPEVVNNRFYEKTRQAQNAYSRGDYVDAYNTASNLLSDKSIEQHLYLLSEAKSILGFCLYLHADKCKAISDKTKLSHMEECKSMEDCGISFLLQSIESQDFSGKSWWKKVHYVLYHHYLKLRQTNGSSIDYKTAYNYLLTAFRFNYPEAIIEIAHILTNTQDSTDSSLVVTKDELIKKLNIIIDDDMNNTIHNISECLYYRGILTKHDNYSASQLDFEDAAQKGHERARQELSSRKRNEHRSNPIFIQKVGLNNCYVNSLSGKNLSVLRSLPSNMWSVFSDNPIGSSGIDVIDVLNLDAFINITNLFYTQNSRTIALFMSEDENKNLSECLNFIDKLFNVALSVSEEQKDIAINNIDIYVSANYETASMFLDASISDMGKNMYFKVHIADEQRDTAHSLLCDAPLFIPFLEKQSIETSIDVVLLGSTETNYRIAKEAIACAYLGEKYPISMTMLGSNASAYENKLRRECPGLYNSYGIRCISPVFIPCDLESCDFPSYIYGNKQEATGNISISETFKNGNYYVVDIGTDFENIQFAMELRTWLLRSRGTFDRTPFIAVRCSNSSNSYLASRLTVSGQLPGEAYYNKFNLFTFGSIEHIYSYKRLIEEPLLQRTALRIHESYYGNNIFSAKNDYYSFSYNSDSSLLTAIGLSYRLFAAGCLPANQGEYLSNAIFKNANLFEDFNKKIKNASILESAAALEQSRWNGYMLSRGWESASVNQVQAYKEQATGSSHKHSLARLHPFIREWEDLNNKELLSILGMLTARFNYKKHPQEITRQSIKDTLHFAICEPVALREELR